MIPFSAAAVPAAVLASSGVLYLVRPGVVENAARSPVAWAVAAGTVLAAVGVRAGLSRAGAPATLARAASVAVVLAIAAVALAPSFQQSTLVEPLPAALTAPAPSAATTTTTTGAPAAPGRSQAAEQLDRSGPLRGIGHRATGAVHLRGAGTERYVVLADVDVEGTVGPSVHLVPTGSRTPAGGVRLGPLKAERGTFSYRVPTGVDARRVWSVLVWCDPYDTPIALAELA